MTPAAVAQIAASLAQFSSATRLYALRLPDGAAVPDAGELLVEAFVADEQLQETGARDVIVLSTSAFVDLRQLVGKAAALEISLADGSRTAFGGEITQAAMLGSEGGMARYRLRLTPWLWRLGQARNSRVWQDKAVLDIVGSVLDSYGGARWRVSDDVAPFMEGVAPRSYCCQYRETDLDFVRRLLAEEGLGWRFEDGEEGQSLVIHADTLQRSAIPEDSSSAAGEGVRFHGVRPGERQDTVQALQARRKVASSLATLQSYDYKGKRAVGAAAPSTLRAGASLPPLEDYDFPGQYAWANAGQAQRYAGFQMQGREARSQLWQGRSTVRTLRAGTMLRISQCPLAGAPDGYTVLRVLSVGVNNLPAPVQQGLAELFGPIPELLQEHSAQDWPDGFALTLAQARESGYANHFEAVAAHTPWRPQLPGSGGRSHPKPTAMGAQSAIVVGADGGDSAQGADELYCDRLGRVRIRFHWQASGDATCWVRVAQRAAGGGMGSQFLPRIGQEVLVQFLENDIDRPIIVGALYNGQGEGGQAPTPGGKPAAAAGAAGLFGRAHDHAPSAQGNLANGHAPLWHGAAAGTGEHRSAASQWGVRSKEFGGAGYSQLLFDDTDGQGRVQLRCSHAASELNLGHLVHGADNYRGSLRGLGAELRTEAYGAVRGGAGLLVTSYAISHAAGAREPAGDNTAGIALMKQAAQLGESFSKAAATHQTVVYASHAGAARAGGSRLDEGAAPLKALQAALSGMVGDASLEAAQADAEARSTGAGEGKLPHSSAALLAVSARAGLGVTAGQGVQLASGETVSLMSGGDSQFASGGQLRAHSGQALGVLGGAVKAGEDGIGLQMVAAADAIDVQAQADTLALQARDDVQVVSANAHVDWSAAKSIKLATAGGASIVIDGGNIVVSCPGKLTIHAGKKSFSGPASMGAEMPQLPRGAMRFDEKFQLLDPAGDPVRNMRYAITKANGARIEGVTDDSGMIPLQQGFSPEDLKIQILGKLK
ncbi:rhs element Vgr protein [Massilia sp. Root351]|uniref:type VI secretion system Vgr family protein n=1 Tax=Massilia sp. Root351 TaxID=1736522 RepID=UPI00070A672D|nr:type VI secretion system Vgr family protein [Massilia sp. Root351]KQV80592.1 rhs element Vgr protein [Massilia sp. Root351]